MTRWTLALVAAVALAAAASWWLETGADARDVDVVEPRDIVTAAPSEAPRDAALTDAIDEAPRALEAIDMATFAAGDAVLVSGRVVTELGAPIPGAALMLVPDGATLDRDAPDFGPMDAARRLARPDPTSPPWTSFARATTDAQGRFAFDVSVFEPAWADGALDSDEDHPLVTVRADGYASRHAVIATPDDEFVVTLAPAVSVDGRVTWADGTPAVGLDVEVLASPVGAWDTRRDWFLRPERTTRTDAGGRYTVDGVPGAMLDVVVARGAFALSRTRADGSTTAHITHDVVIERGPRLEVTVMSDGRGLRDAEVFAFVPDEARPRSRRALSDRLVAQETLPILRRVDDPEARVLLGAARTDASGAANLDLPAGTPTCALLVASPGHAAGYVPLIELDRDVLRHTLDLAPESVDTIEVVDAVSGEPADVEVAADYVDGYTDDAVLRSVGVGRFALSGRGDDVVVLTVSAPGSANQYSTITGTSRRHVVEWTPTPPAVVRGRVVSEDGAPLAEAWIYLSMNDEASAGLPHEPTQTDDDGRFELSARPGPHVLSAIAEHHDIGQLELDLASGELDVGDVVLTTTGRLEIVDCAGDHNDNLTVQRDVGAGDDTEWKAFYHLILTVQGRGVVERLPAGRYRIERRGHAMKVFDVVAGETSTVEYSCEDPVRLIVDLVGTDGAAFTLTASSTTDGVDGRRALLAPTQITDRLDTTVPFAPRIDLQLRDGDGALVLIETLADVTEGSAQTVLLEVGSATLDLTLGASTANCVVSLVIDGTPRGNFRADREAGTHLTLPHVPLGVIDVEVHACGLVRRLTIDTTRVSTLTVRRREGLPIAIDVVAD